MVDSKVLRSAHCVNPHCPRPTGVQDGDKYCPYCGVRQTKSESLLDAGGVQLTSKAVDNEFQTSDPVSPSEQLVTPEDVTEVISREQFPNVVESTNVEMPDADDVSSEYNKQGAHDVAPESPVKTRLEGKTMQNYYLILGLSQTASDDEIKAAISAKRKAEAKNQNHAKLERRQEAERIMQVLHEAQLILLDSQKRAKYDQELKSAPREEREIDESDLKGKEDLVAMGWQLLIKGEVADALFVATQAAEQDGSNADAWALLAQAKHRWGETEDAIYEYKRAIKLRPNDAEFYYDLGIVYESADLANEAYTQYQRAAQINPETTYYRAAVGALLVKKNEFEEGIRVIEQCIKEEPDNESYKWFHALGLGQRAESYFWENPEDGTISVTSKDAAEKARQDIDQALALAFEDDDLRSQLKKMKEYLNGMNKRTFFGSWILVAVWALFYVVPGVLMYAASLRPRYKIQRDLQKLVEENKGEDKFAGGEYGAYVHALPPGMKWAATLPRFIVWIVMVVLSPITFLYNVYDNWVAE